MIIRRFENKDYQSLIDFNCKNFNKRDKIEESIIHRFFNNPFSVKDKSDILIAIDDRGEIIGQILVMLSEFNHEGNVYPAFLGMDYFVTKEARNSLAGIRIANKYKDLKYNLGIGLTDASLAIMRAFNVPVVGYMSKYIKLTNIFSILKFLLASKIKTQSKFAPPGSINLKGGRFVRVFNADELISETGYWNKNLLEFTRCKAFINWRFYSYPDKYFVYRYFTHNSENNSIPNYFVVRPIIWKNSNCLLLVDYRFDPELKSMFNNILNSVGKSSQELKMAATITECSLPECEVDLKRNLFFKFGRKMEIVSKYPINLNKNESEKNSILVTFADSDGDFYYGNDKW